MSLDIEFSEHALLKIEILASHGVVVSEEFVTDVIQKPDKEEEGYSGRVIAQKRLDDAHVLRVVYEKEPNRILVITVYPGRRARYEKN